MPIIHDTWRDQLHAFLGGVVRNTGGIPQNVGGVADHVHLLMGLNSTHILADVIRDLKAVSSRWIHETIGIAHFAWQEGYGAFTVSASQRVVVAEYITRQGEHHRQQSFKEEYVKFLQHCGVDYDSRYLW